VEKLENADIGDQDREAIRMFVRVHRMGNQNRKPNTIYSNLSTLRNASLRAEVSLVKMGRVDYRLLLTTLTAPESQSGYGLALNKSGIRGYKRVLRLPFRWLDDQPDFGDFGFYGNIELQSQNITRINEDEILSPEEVQDLNEAVNDQRDAAFIEFLPCSVA
jgi:integrase/recombinase XerD